MLYPLVFIGICSNTFSILSLSVRTSLVRRAAWQSANASVYPAIYSNSVYRRVGFTEVFALGALQCFHEDELEAMLCRVGKKWSVDKLAETIKRDHGCACSVTT